MQGFGKGLAEGDTGEDALQRGLFEGAITSGIEG